MVHTQQVLLGWSRWSLKCWPHFRTKPYAVGKPLGCWDPMAHGGWMICLRMVFRPWQSMTHGDGSNWPDSFKSVFNHLLYGKAAFDPLAYWWDWDVCPKKVILINKPWGISHLESILSWHHRFVRSIHPHFWPCDDQPLKQLAPRIRLPLFIWSQNVALVCPETQNFSETRTCKNICHTLACKPEVWTRALVYWILLDCTGFSPGVSHLSPSGDPHMHAF